MTHRASALGNDNTTAVGDGSFTITVPGTVQAGDVMAVTAVMNTGTATFAISGGGSGSSWAVREGPDDNSSNQRTYLWTKTATASSASSTITVTASGGTGRFVGVMRADYDVLETGLLTALATDTSADSSLAFASVPIPDATGWHLVGIGSMRVAAATAATVSSAPAGSTVDGQSNTVVASPNYTAITLHKNATVGSGAQSMGTGTASGSVTNNLYTIGYPPAATGVTVEGATAAATGEAHAGAATGSGAVAIVTAAAHAGEAVAASQDELVVGATAEAFADAHAGLAPALAITATPEPGGAPPRVRVDITDTRAVPATSVTVLRTDPDGRQHAVRTSDGGPFGLTLFGTDRAGVLYDYEAPFGQQVTYTLAENLQAVSPTTLDVPDVWLIHPGVPSRSMRIRVAGISPLARRVQRGVFYPLGNRYPIVNTDGRRKAPEGTLMVRTESDPDRAAMDALLDDAQTLLLNVPAAKKWGLTALYIAVGDAEEARFLNWGSHPYRNWPLPFVVVDRPAGGAQAQWNLDEVDAAYADLDEVKATYPTLADLQANTPAA